MKKFLEIGGFIAGAVLIIFGVAVIALGVNGRSTVNSSLKPGEDRRHVRHDAGRHQGGGREGRPRPITLPELLGRQQGRSPNGSTARCFAQYMRIHALEATGGLTYCPDGPLRDAPTASRSATNDATKAVSGERAARRQRRPQRLGHRDRADHRAQRQLHGEPALALQHRGRNRAPARRGRVRDPRLRGSPPAQARSTADAEATAAAQGDEAGSRLRLPAWKPGEGRGAERSAPRVCSSLGREARLAADRVEVRIRLAPARRYFGVGARPPPGGARAHRAAALRATRRRRGCRAAPDARAARAGPPP